jgi:hypothetical protein
MLCSVRSGDAPGESTWDRQDYQRGYMVRSRSDRRYADVARRGLKRAERAEVAAEIAAAFDDIADDIADVAAQAAIDALWDEDDDYRGCGPYCELCSAEAAEAAILTDAGVNTFAELATVVAAQIAEEVERELDAGSPGWGDSFDPTEIQWGFSVRTRF